MNTLLILWAVNYDVFQCFFFLMMVYTANKINIEVLQDENHIYNM